MQTFISFLFLLLPFAVSSLDRVMVKDGMFVSREDGRTLIFHGINSVIKRFPWYDPKMLDPVRQQQLKDWGFNNVRLGMMWSGLEPSEGQVNETYSGIITSIVEGLADKGIYSYLDMHQDVLTQTADGYWGIPSWVGEKLEKPDHPYPWPMKDTSGFSTWACGYFSQEISNAFQQLYTNKSGATDYMANFWLQVAQRFKDNPAVLGYELINEPWTGDLYQDASLILPGNAGQLLQPFYDAISQKIRSIDNETIIFWEPVTYAYFVNPKPHILLDAVINAYLETHDISIFFPLLKRACGDLDEEFMMEYDIPSLKEDDLLFPGQLLEAKLDMFGDLHRQISEAEHHRFNEVNDIRAGRPSIFGPGFTAPPGGPEYLDRTAMSWHYYCWAIGYGSSDDDYDPVLRAGCDTLLGPMVFDTVDARAKELGGSATFLTEFGICEPDATLTNSTGLIECNFVLDEADLHLQSWSYWDTAGGGVFWDAQGNPRLDTVRVFSRPYPPATAGTPLSINYNFTTRVFEYTFKPDLTLAPSAMTEIYVPPLVYDQGYSVQTPPDASWSWAPIQGEFKIAITVLKEVEKVTVVILPI